MRCTDDFAKKKSMLASDSCPQPQRLGEQRMNTMGSLGRTVVFYISEWETVLFF